MTRAETVVPGRSGFRRDRLTFTLYATFITWGWFLYGFSPAVPLIAEEQGISRALAGLHGTALAVGAILTATVSSTVAVRLGRRVQTLLGAGLLVVGCGLLLAGQTLPATLAACLVTSIGGNLAISAAQPALSVHHGPAGPAAVTEANAVGATVGLFAPLALGASVALGWGWRPAVAVVALLAGGAALLVAPLRATGALGRGARPRPASPPAPRRARRFPRTFWFFWTALLCGVAVEFATVFWASDLILQQTDAPASVATAAVSALIVGMSVSRFVVGPLSLRKAPEKLLLVGFATAGAGWLVFWLAPSPGIAVAGLVLAGLGYGTHYPLAVSLAMRASRGQPDQAQALASLGTGGAVAVAPFVLGALADVVGAHLAFLLVPVVLVAGATAVALGLRSVRATAA